MRGRSDGTGSGRPAAARTAAVGRLAVPIFAVLILVFAGVLKLLGVPGGWPYALSVPLVAAVYWPLVWWTVIWRDLERPVRPSRWRWRRPRNVPWMALLWGYLMPFVAVLMIVMAAVDFSTTWPAAHDGGRPGTLLLQSRSCGRGHCTWHGRFHSDDGAVIRESVMMRDDVPAEARVGDEVRARDTGNRSFVFAESGSSDWGGAVGLIGLAAVYLFGWGACLLILIRTWRTAPRRRRGT